MKFSMLRGSLSLAAAAAVAALVVMVPLSSAHAGSGKSPFAGTYAWGSSSVTISDRGQIEGSGPSPIFYMGTIQGRVNDDGSYSFTMTVTYPVMDNPERRTHGPDSRTAHFKFAGTLAPDASGNLVGTPGTGDAFVWVLQ